MTMGRFQHRWMRVFVPLVWLAIVQVLVLSMLAASPELHEYCHPDTHDSGHHCLASDFNSGLIEQPLVVPIVAPCFAPVFVESVAMASGAWQSLPLHLCGSLLVHGPPTLA